MSLPINSSTTRPKLFISYSCPDVTPARDLDAHLRKYGVRTFMYLEDRDGYELGQMLPDVVLQELGWCDFFLLVWSRFANVSDWVSSEIRIVLDYDKLILPYRLDNTPLPHEIASQSSVVADTLWNEEELLRRIYGDLPVPQTPVPVDIQIEPGLWQIDITNVLQTVTLKLHLHEDSSLSGQQEQKNITGQVIGGWTYDKSDLLLTMKLEIRVGLRPNREVLRVHLTKQQNQVIYGEDMYALGPVVCHYTLQPVR